MSAPSDEVRHPPPGNELAPYLAAMAVLTRFDSSEALAADAIDLARAALRDSLAPAEGVAAATAAFEHWAGAFESARAATTYAAIKAWARRYLCTPGPHAASAYNIAQGAMKAAIHLSWKRLYTLRVRGGHEDPREAVLDATTPPKLRAIQYYNALYAELAAENGETVEAMVSRLCGD